MLKENWGLGDTVLPDNFNDICKGVNQNEGDISDIKTKIENGEVGSKNAVDITIEDATNVFTAINVEDALLENKTSILNKVDIVVTDDRNIERKDKTFYFVVTDEQSTGGSTPSGDIKVSPNMGIKIV